MELKIKNIKLDKDVYIYWIDKNINLSFELESNKNEIIKEITIFYWYNFYWENEKNNAFNDKIIEKNKNISANIIEKFSFTIPISFFNLYVNDWVTNMKIENYININIVNWAFNKNLKEKLIPNIIIDKSEYWLQNLIVSNHIESSKYYINKIEKLILKSNNDDYSKIIKEIEKTENDLLKVTDINLDEHIYWKEKEYNLLSDEINKLNKEKEKFFIIKDNEKNNLKELIEKKEKNIKKIENYFWDDLEEINKLINELNIIQKEIYKCYSSENETEYYEIIDNYYTNNNNDKNKWNSEINHLSKRIEIWKNIEKNEWDFIIINKKFKWMFFWTLNSFLEKDYLSADYIHKDIYEKLKKNILVNVFDKLVKSKIYNFIYKFIFIVPFLLFVNLLFDDLILKSFSENFKILIILIPILFIIFSKILEKIFQKKLNKLIYDFKLVNKKDIENNLENKLLSWNLKIFDFIDKLNIKVWNNNMDYNFYVKLGLNVWTYSQNWKSTIYHYHNVYSLDLFNYTWKWNFDLSKINLLTNNYNKLNLILPNSNKNKWTKIYYTIDYKFDSFYLPNLSWNINLDLKF